MTKYFKNIQVGTIEEVTNADVIKQMEAYPEVYEEVAKPGEKTEAKAEKKEAETEAETEVEAEAPMAKAEKAKK